LVIWISETKDNLNKFKDDSIKHLSILKQVLSDYTQDERKQVARYLRSNGRIKPYNTIERLQVDLFNFKYGIPTIKPNEDKKVMVM